MKIVIIGGVAGGASAAARARRLDDSAEVILIERGGFPSFANCGMPYYVGGVIQSRDKLLVAPVQMLRERHHLDVRTRSEVTSIDRETKTIQVQPLESGESYTESYDKLIIATGASPVSPPLPGIDHERVLRLRNLDDADVMHRVATADAKRAIIIGGGFIGVEVAENLVHRGIHTTLIERGTQLLGPWDPEMVVPIEQAFKEKGIELMFKTSVTGFQPIESGINVQVEDQPAREADFVVLSIGVTPENRLAKDAGLSCGQRGGVIVNRHMQTDDPNIYAVGDVVEVHDLIGDCPTQIPLAGPANRQGRIAADHAFGRTSQFRGVQGTSVVGAFGVTAAMTGWSEKLLQRNAVQYEKIYIHPANHAGYYPGAEGMTLKLLFSPSDGRIFGAQGVGGSGVDKRIDVISMAIQANLTVEDLEESELCYAPQYGSAKDPVNMLGFVASDVIRGDQPVTHVDGLLDGIPEGTFLLDVRSVPEYQRGHIPGAVNIPIEELRERLDEVPSNQQITAYCQVGIRGYLATRVLMQKNYRVANLSGGYKLWQRYGIEPEV